MIEDNEETIEDNEEKETTEDMKMMEKVFALTCIFLKDF